MSFLDAAERLLLTKHIYASKDAGSSAEGLSSIWSNNDRSYKAPTWEPYEIVWHLKEDFENFYQRYHQHIAIRTWLFWV